MQEFSKGISLVMLIGAFVLLTFGFGGKVSDPDTTRKLLMSLNFFVGAGVIRYLGKD